MTNLRALERMAQIVYGEEAWVYNNNGDIGIFRNDRDVEFRGVSVEQVVAHLIDVNQRQQAAFNEVLRELGESK